MLSLWPLWRLGHMPFVSFPSITTARDNHS